MISRQRLAGIVAALMTAAAMAGLPAIASAHEGEWAKFNNCPSTNPTVNKCINSVVTGGEVILGSKKVPIVNPITIQGGYTKLNFETGFSSFVGATNGVTLSKSPQPIPGGLAGLVNCKEISSGFLRGSCELIFENGLTGVNSTVELARPASEIQISEGNLLFQEGVALQLPVKVHLENPLLGSNCYIGSSSSPIVFNLTTGTTEPPAPNSPITGEVGSGVVSEGGQLLTVSNSLLVDNAWSAPGANGCGGVLFEWILDPIIDASSGVPAAGGVNTAKQITTSTIATAKAVNAH